MNFRNEREIPPQHETASRKGPSTFSEVNCKTLDASHYTKADAGLWGLLIRVESASWVNVVRAGEDTDLLVLLSHYSCTNGNYIFFQPESRHNVRKKKILQQYGHEGKPW